MATSGDYDVAERAASPQARASLHTLRYSASAPLKIFLSYGHDRFQALAFHLKAALQQRGHKVWVDTERLSAGLDWEDGIAGALAWVRDAQQDGRVLLIMTPHALRRPDGYCLNEVARAAAMRLSIFPVLVADSVPPPCVALLPFFDLRDCVPCSTEQLTLAAESPTWQELMRGCLDGPGFRGKAERLYALLELFDSMTSYGVPAVAGLANLGLFPGYDTSHHETPRGNSVRRLLSPSPSLSPHSHAFSFDALPINQDVSHTQSLTLEIPVSPIKRPQTSETPATLTSEKSAPASPFVGDRHGILKEDKTDQEVEIASRKTRYVLSYDDSCYVLAQQIYDDLTAAGFSVFPLPSPSPPANGSLTGVEPVGLEDVHTTVNTHEDALRWASADKNGKLILLLTSESVGRPRGVSLNDVSAAMAAGLGFVPLLVRPCEIPLSICRIQWLDMADCLLYGSSTSLNRVRYESRRAQLVAALEGGTLDHEGQQTRLFSLLAPFSFQRQISQLTERFVGREWLFGRLQHWLQTSASPSSSPTSSELGSRRVFWVTGQIGSGKTSVAARMVQTCPEIAAFHFAQQEDEQTHSARRCVLSLAYQLTTQLPEYALFLQSHEPLEEIVPVASFPELVTHLLVGPLNAIARPSSSKPLVLLIDGLEWLLPASGSGSLAPPPSLARSWRKESDEECLVAMLPALVPRLPAWVRVVLLSRDDPMVLSRLQPFGPPDVAIDRFQHENDQDIRHYLSVTLPTPDESDGSTPDQIVELIARRSEGLFLYAVNVVQAIQEGRLRAHELAALPVGMSACLQQFFASHFADPDVYKRRVRPVLEVLCAAYEPLPLATLARVLEWDVYEQRDVSATLGSLFYVETGSENPESHMLRPFHSSVLDWVQDSGSAGAFFADVASGHERLGRWAAREYQTVVRAKSTDFVNLNYELESTGDERLKAKVYIVRHACNHLMQARGVDCMQLVAAFAADEKFQLARRLLHLRAEGLQSFFHGDVSRERAQELLARRQPHRVGSFLIRYTARQKAYCASFVAALDPQTDAPKFRHNLIYHLSNGAYSAVPPADVTDETVVFPDLVSFVEQYQRKGILTAPVAREAPLNREISSG